MKIFHCSDIHLGKRPFGTKEFMDKRYIDFFNAFNQLIDKAIEEKVDLFIVAGDLFDKKELTPDVLQRSEKAFLRLKENNIPAFIIEGNHDNINESDLINSWTNYLEKKELLKRGDYKYMDGEYIFDKYILNDVNIYGLGYPGFAIDDVLLKISEVLNPEEKNIVVVHTGTGGSELLPGLAMSSSIKALEGKVIYIAGGHLHGYQVYPKEKPFLFIPGSSEYWNVSNEKNDKKGGILFDTDTLEYRFIPINPRRRIKVKFEPPVENIEEEFKNFCEELHLTGEELVLVTINVPDSRYINTSKLVEILESCGALKGYINLNFKRNNLEIEDGKNYSIKEIERNIIDSWENFKNKDSICNYLQKYKEYSGDKDRENDLFDLFDQMLEEEIEDEN